MDGHDGLGQAAVQLPVPGDVAAEPHGQAAHDDLEAPAQRVSLFAGLVDGLDHGGAGLRVQGADRRGVGRGVQVGGQALRDVGLDGTDPGDVAAHRRAERAQKRLGHRAAGDPSRRLASGGPLQHVPGVAAVVLEDAREVGVARPGEVDGAQRLRVAVGLRGAVGHGDGPVLPVPVPHEHRDRRAQGLAQPDARDHFRPVRFDLHPAAPAVPALAPFQLRVDVSGRVEAQAGRDAFDHGDQPSAVGLPGGVEGQAAERHGRTSRGAR